MSRSLLDLSLRHPIVAAHRGARHQAPENTLAAFEAAFGLGAKAIELDVQLTRDGQVVVFHDWRLERTSNGHGLLRDHTLASLRTLDAGSWFAPEFAHERIPLLAEVLSALPAEVIVNVELKPGHLEDVGFERRVAELVQAHHLEQRVVFASFDHVAIQRIKRIAPHIAAIITSGARLAEEPDYVRRLSADGSNHSVLWWTPELSAAYVEAGLLRHGSLINDRDEFDAAIALDLDLVDSDNPNFYGQAWLEHQKS
jgi:glycerophosphoryl diester phosphodiesterase